MQGLAGGAVLPNFNGWLKFYGAPVREIGAANDAGTGYRFRNRLIGQLINAAEGAALRRQCEIAAAMGPFPEFSEIAEHLAIELGRAPDKRPVDVFRDAIAHWPGPGRVSVTGWPAAEMIEFVRELQQLADETAPAIADTTAAAAAAAPDRRVLTSALARQVRRVIDDINTEARSSGKKPPNINELSALVQKRLAEMGKRASRNVIRNIAADPDFKNQRLRQGEKPRRP